MRTACVQYHAETSWSSPVLCWVVLEGKRQTHSKTRFLRRGEPLTSTDAGLGLLPQLEIPGLDHRTNPNSWQPHCRAAPTATQLFTPLPPKSTSTVIQLPTAVVKLTHRLPALDEPAVLSESGRIHK